MKKYATARYASVLTLILASLLLTACNTNVRASTSTSSNSNEVAQAAPNAGSNSTAVAQADDFAMGTIISQKVYGENGQAAIDQALARIRYLEELVTFNAPEGDIYGLNENAGKKKVELNPITIELIKKSQEVAELSQGAFDITIGPVVKAWGIGTEHQRVPSATEIQNLLQLTNYKDLVVENNTANLKRPRQMVDLGGIAKGYAGDEVIAIYKKNGIQSAFVNLGGNVMTLGGKPDGSPWSVGIRNPRGDEVGPEQQIIGAVTVRNKAVVTAGDGERFFIQDGKRYHHILDPHTGYPAQSDLMSVTLIMDSSFDADALDTAVFISGLEKGMELIKKYGGIEAIFITTDKRIIVTEGLKGNFQLLDENGDYQLMP